MYDASNDLLITYILETGRAVDSTTEQLPANIRAHLESSDIVSIVAAPVYHNKHRVGVLRAATAKMAVFGNRVLSQFIELASAAGLVIGTQRRRRGLMHSVLRAAEEIVRPSSLEDTLKAVVDSSFHAFDLDCVTIWYKQHDSDELAAGPQRGATRSRPRKDGETDSTLVRSVMKRKSELWASNAQGDSELRDSSFIQREKIVSTVAFPLRGHNTVVGALFFNYRSSHQFTREEEEVMPILAAIAAAAIKDAQLLQVAERGRERLLAALEVAKAAAMIWERENVLPTILIALRDHFGKYVANATPYLLLYNSEDRVLELPKEVRGFYPPAGRHSDPIRLTLDAKRVICWVTQNWLNGEKQKVVNIPDVTDEKQFPDYEHPDPQTRAELCAGLWRNETLQGVLVLQSQQTAAFIREDEQLFELVAEQVAATLERANQVAEKRVKDYLMGAMAWASDLAHDINIDVGLIRDNAYRIWDRDPGVTEEGKRWAREIDAKASELKDKARDAGSERELMPTELGPFLEKRVENWQARACPNTKIDCDWGDKPLLVSVYPEQLWRAVRHLLRNAIEAMERKGQIWLHVRSLESDRVELRIENIGPDIPLDVRRRLFREPFSSKGKKEGGKGLLLAKLLIEDMKGELSLLPPLEGHGPIFSIRLLQAQATKEEYHDIP